MSTARIAIAVDGGGTRTVACVAAGQNDGQSKILATAEAGPGNPAVVGLEAAKSSIADAVARSLTEAAVERPDVQFFVAGLAGIEATNHREDLLSWAQQALGMRNAEFLTDVELVLLAGQHELPAVVLISGTGSVAIGRNSQGDVARCGGRGYLIGDEGSGFWIGQQGLRAAVRALDHAAPRTALVERFAAQLGSQTPNQLTQAVYTDVDPRKKLAGLAEEVIATAEHGDAIAAGIIDAAGRELSHLVASVTRQLSLTQRPFDLILAGGVLVHADSVREAVARHCSRLSIEAMRIIDSPAQDAAKRLCW